MVYEKIKLLRENSGMTQTDLAKKLGITRSSVNAWEMGISVPSTQYLVQLSLLFKVTTDYLLGIQSELTLKLDGLSEDELQIIYSIIKYFKLKE